MFNPSNSPAGTPGIQTYASSAAQYLTPAGQSVQLPIEIAKIFLSGQGAAIPAGTLLCAVPNYLNSQQQLRITFSAKMTTAGSTGGSIGPLALAFTDQDGTAMSCLVNAADTMTGRDLNGAASVHNSTVNGLQGAITINAQAGTTVTYSFGYNSSNVGTVYEISIFAEAV